MTSRYFWNKKRFFLMTSGSGGGGGGEYWYLPPGVSDADVIAAYTFKGAASSTAALKNRAGTGSVYDLSENRSPSWTAANGYYVGANNGSYLHSTNLGANYEIKTIVIRFAGLSTANTAILPLSLLKGQTGAGTANPLFYARPNFCVIYDGVEKTISSTYPCIVTALNTTTEKLTYKVGTAKVAAAGILACDASHIYYNGSAMALTTKTTTCDSSITTEINLHTQYSYAIAANAAYPYYVIGAAFYNKVLSAAAHAWIAESLIAL